MPTGWAKKSDSDLPPKFFGRIALANTEMSERNGAQGWLSVMTTVDVPCAVTFLIAKSRKPSGPLELAASRSMEKTTSSAVSGVPSENVTPGRSWKVHVMWSALVV